MKDILKYFIKSIGKDIMVFLAITIFSMAIVECKGNADKQSVVTENNAIDKSGQYISNIGENIFGMDRKVILSEGQWNECINKEFLEQTGVANDEYFVKIRNKLIDKKYWVVRYYRKAKLTPPEGLSGGGSFCVFIDASSGEVITDYRDK